MSHTPEHAILESLDSMRLNLFGPEGGPRPLRFRVQPDSVRFVKNRAWPGRQLSYVSCDAEVGSSGTEPWHWTVLATEEAPGRWSAHGVAGGGGRGDECLTRGSPWANLGGHWGRDGFRAGGAVEDAGRGVALVRLTDAEGRTFEDSVDDGVVLLMSDEPVAMPMRLDLFDADGRVVGTDEWGFVDE